MARYYHEKYMSLSKLEVMLGLYIKNQFSLIMKLYHNLIRLKILFTGGLELRKGVLF